MITPTGSFLLYCVVSCAATTFGGTASVIAAGQNPQSQQASDDRKGSGVWLKLAPQGAPFSVLLPAQPAEKTKDDSTGMKVHTYKLKAGQIEYQVVWFASVPYAVLQRGSFNVLFPRGLEDILKSARQEGKKGLLTTHEQDIIFNGYHARESTMESGSEQLDARAFIAGGDLITIAVLYPKNEPSIADANRFLKSFYLPDPDLAITGTSSDKTSGVSAATNVDTRPIPLNRPRPEYTEKARKHGVEGMVRARVLIGVDGLVSDVRLLTHLADGLDDEATKAIRKMQFKPATKDGQPVAFWVTMEVEFHLRKGKT